MKVTVRDIAAAAQVSVGTVSRVLNGDPTVSHDKQTRVAHAASSMNYRRLRRRPAGREGRISSAKIGLIMLGMDQALTSLPVVASAVQGVEKAVAEAHGSLMLLSAPTLEVPMALARERLDGVIVKGALQGPLYESTDPRLREFLCGVPTVWIMGRPFGFSGSSVSTHDARVGQMAAHYLWKQGHRHVAFLNPKGDHLSFRGRQLSFVDWIRNAGGQVESIVADVERSVSYPLPPIREAAQISPLVERLLALRPQPTAVFVPADNIAALVYGDLAARGMRVGRDLSVISSNFEAARIMSLYPALTTIDVRAEQIGRCAVELLRQTLVSRDMPPVEWLLDPALVEGESVAPALESSA